jgi:hypothetical protein
MVQCNVSPKKVVGWTRPVTPTVGALARVRNKGDIRLEC